MAESRIRVVRTIGTTEPVTLAEAKNYLRITVDTADDALITSQISAAREIAEQYLSRDLLSKEIEQTHIISNDGIIHLYRSPITSVDSVVVDGTTETLDEGYELRGANDNQVVFLTTAQAFSDDEPVGPYRNVVVTYTTTGFTNEIVKQGVLAILQCLYDQKMNYEWKKILAPYKILFV